MTRGGFWTRVFIFAVIVGLIVFGLYQSKH